MRSILFIAPALSIGGLQFHLIRLANSLQGQGYSISVLLMSSENEILDLLSPEITIITLPGRSSDPRLWMRLRRKLITVSPDVAIGWSTFPSLLLCLLKLTGLRIKVISTELNYPPMSFGHGFRSYLMHALTRALYRYADKISANSDVTVGYLKSLHPKNNIVRILNPVEITDTPARKPADAGWETANPRILTVGRLLNKHKGFDVLLMAMKIVVHQKPQAKLLIVGDGPDRATLERMISDHGLSDFVFLHGADPGVKIFLERADIFVLSSNYEGFPNVLIEAMMSGLVSVATNCKTGPSEIIVDGINGYLCQTGDPTEMAKKIVSASLLKGESLRAVQKNAKNATDIYTVDSAGLRYAQDVLDQSAIS